MLCDYGCGQEATHLFKNGKWCCSKNISLCPAIKDKIGDKKKDSVMPESAKEKIRLANVGKKASSKTRLKMSISHKKRNRSKLKEETKRKISLSQTGQNNSNAWKIEYTKNKIPLYKTYHNQLSIDEKPQPDINDNNILTVVCSYCGKRYIPSINEVGNRVRSLKGTSGGECRLYCSDQCKQECPIFNQTLWPKDFKPATSREVQPELRQMRFKIDNYTCQKCGKNQDELKIGLHCHHIEGIRWEPLESADIDKVISYCKYCHIEVHKQKGCGYREMRCE